MITTRYVFNLIFVNKSASLDYLACSEVYLAGPKPPDMRQGGLYLYYVYLLLYIYVKVAMQVLDPFVVDKEFDTNYKAFMDETPLHVCAIYGSPKVCLWLLGVEDKKGRRLANPAAKDKNGWAPIHYAARFGHNDVLEMLRRLHRNQVEQLFLRDAKPYADPVTEDGWTPLHVAARFEQIDIITSLLNSGAAKEGGSAEREPRHAQDACCQAMRMLCGRSGGPKGVPAPRSSAEREPGDGDSFARTRLRSAWPSFECRYADIY